MHGDIRLKWARLRGHRGFLGYPRTDEQGCPDGRGRFNHFEGGVIYWTPQTGAREVHGDILATWSRLGAERSRLGYPTSDETGITGGRVSRFERGEIRWTPQGGTKVVLGTTIDDAAAGAAADAAV